MLGDTRRATAVGASLLGLQLRGGALIRGLIVDNPSGQWLRVYPDGDYVAPYTMGWSLSWRVGRATVDIKSGEAPAGQINTLQGDPFSATLYEDEVGSSPGSQDPAFITQFTPILSASASFQVSSLVNNTTTLVAAIANKRFRVLSYSFAKFGLGLFDDSGVWYIFRSGTGAVTTGGLLGPLTYESGTQRWEVDFPVGTSIVVEYQGDWAAFQVTASVTYQVL